MSGFRNVAVFINRKSGSAHSIEVSKLLIPLSDRGFTLTVREWMGDGDPAGMVDDLLHAKPDLFLAAGGDGTVNLVASKLKFSPIPMGIIPAGSGNGLARYLGIPENPYQAIQHILSGKSVLLDAGEINGHFFCCTAGVGFDALVANEFAVSKHRGFSGYVKQVLRLLPRITNFSCSLYIDGQQHVFPAAMVTFCNTPEFGNGVFIAPEANASDGVLNVTGIPLANKISLPALTLRLFCKSIHKAREVFTATGKDFDFHFQGAEWLHTDGEPHRFYGRAQVKILKGCITVIA